MSSAGQFSASMVSELTLALEELVELVSIEVVGETLDDDIVEVVIVLELDEEVVLEASAK